MLSKYKKGPLSPNPWKALPENPLPYAGLVTSLVGDRRYLARTRGKIPPDLVGSLYRNGPGLFDRANGRKRMVLDGDGLIQAFHFRGSEVEYIAKFVKTSKFLREEETNRFEFPTWSTLAPGGPLKNLFGRIANQAGVTVLADGRESRGILAFDEAKAPYELDGDLLETIGPRILDTDSPHLEYHAHWKYDVDRSGWAALALEFGKVSRAHLRVFRPDGSVKGRRTCELPRSVYIHDWFLTPNYVVLALHPAFVSLGSYLKVTLGLTTFAEIVQWRPGEGTCLFVIPRDPALSPFHCESEALFMWHSANAYEEGDELVLDFVGNSSGGGLGSDDSPFFELMKGKEISLPNISDSHLRRYRIDRKARTAKVETLAGGFNYEMPMVIRDRRCLRHESVFLAQAEPGKVFWNSIVRRDIETGKSDRFFFGGESFCTEPVLAEGKDGVIWCLTEVYDHPTRQSRLCILRSDHLNDGPVGEVLLEHHAPLSFHGCWRESLW